jgi:hypothetical protein
MGRLIDSCCGLSIGRNGFTVVVEIVEVVEVEYRTSVVCQGRFRKGIFFFKSGLLNGYLNAEL